jgi:hypothetical protein
MSDQRYIQAEGILLSVLAEDEAILHKADEDAYFTLNELSLFMWNVLEQPSDIAAIVTAVRGAYDVDLARVTADVEALLSDLQAKNLIKPA